MRFEQILHKQYINGQMGTTLSIKEMQHKATKSCQFISATLAQIKKINHTDA